MKKEHDLGSTVPRYFFDLQNGISLLHSKRSRYKHHKVSLSCSSVTGQFDTHDDAQISAYYIFINIAARIRMQATTNSGTGYGFSCQWDRSRDRKLRNDSDQNDRHGRK